MYGFTQYQQPENASHFLNISICSKNAQYGAFTNVGFRGVHVGTKIHQDLEGFFTYILVDNRGFSGGQCRDQNPSGFG